MANILFRVIRQVRDWISGTDLATAAREGRTMEVDRLLDRGRDPARLDAEGFSALHHACHFGYATMTRLLLNRRADPHRPTADGRLPIHLAASGERPPDWSREAIWGAPPPDREKSGRHMEVIALLASAGANPNVRAPDGRTPLDFAQEEPALMTELIRRGADPRQSANHGWALMAAAIRKQDLALLDLLVSRGLDPTRRTAKGETLFHVALSFDRPLIILEALDRLGVDPRSPDADARTPLHLAAKLGSAMAIRFLLDRGADPSALNRWGWTPLHEAAKEGFREAFEILAAAGADPGRRTPDGQTAREMLDSYTWDPY